MKGYALIHSGKLEGLDFFRKKILKYPDQQSEIAEFSKNIFSRVIYHHSLSPQT